MLISFVKKGQSLFILSFTLWIAAGMLLLKIPAAYHAGVLSWNDALFIATSSVCVNGLTVVKVSDFTLLGQLIILGLVQLGGIGFMTLSASILLMLGRGLSFSNTLLISNLSDNFSLRGTEGLTRTVILYTLVSEGIGLLFLVPGFLLSGYGVWQSLWYGVFHAITGFCNAGLSPFDDSLIGQSRLTQFGVACMIVLGGLGVYVIYDLLQVMRKRQMTLRVHSKVVLLTSAILIVSGAVFLWLLGTVRGGAGTLGWFDAFFLSITSRTAGFTTVGLDVLPPASITMVIVWMLIGASPGSTGGGIKTSTVAVAVAAIINTFQGNRDVLVFRRRIPNANVLRAFTIIVLFVLLACAGAIVGQLLTRKATMMECFFEAVSAIGTTGLTIGGTGKLTEAGKLFLSLFMFMGRIGPFTIMLFLMGREKRAHLRYPEERVIIS